MNNLIIMLAICLALISPTGAGTLLSTSGTILGGGTYLKYLANIEAERVAAEKAEQERIAAEEEAYRILHTYGNFERYDIEGYSIINVPETHFTLNVDKSSKKAKTFAYTYNELSYLDIKFQTNITEDDIENIGVNICGFKDEPVHEKVTCGDLEAIKLIGSDNTDDYSRISWCVTKGKSVLILNGYIAPGIDKIPFSEAVESAIAKTSIYYISKTVFETPTSGYYATVDLGQFNNKDDEDTNSETTEPVVEDNTVGGELPGTIKTDKVTNNWEELRVVLDGNILTVPCKISDLMEYGYKIKDADVVGDIVKIGYQAKLILYKDNGIAITVHAQNTTESSLRIEALEVDKIIINKDDFGYYVTDSKFNKENLPELIAVSGITWDVEYETIKSLQSDFVKKELVNGDFQLTFSRLDKTLIITTQNYKDINQIEMAIDMNYNKE